MIRRISGQRRQSNQFEWHRQGYLEGAVKIFSLLTEEDIKSVQDRLLEEPEHGTKVEPWELDRTLRQSP